jgi:hypothetical protein
MRYRRYVDPSLPSGKLQIVVADRGEIPLSTGTPTTAATEVDAPRPEVGRLA